MFLYRACGMNSRIALLSPLAGSIQEMNSNSWPRSVRVMHLLGNSLTVCLKSTFYHRFLDSPVPLSPVRVRVLNINYTPKPFDVAQGRERSRTTNDAWGWHEHQKDLGNATSRSIKNKEIPSIVGVLVLLSRCHLALFYSRICRCATGSLECIYTPNPTALS